MGQTSILLRPCLLLLESFLLVQIPPISLASVGKPAWSSPFALGPKSLSLQLILYLLETGPLYYVALTVLELHHADQGGLEPMEICLPLYTECWNLKVCTPRVTGNSFR